MEISGKAFDYAHAKVADAMKAIMSWARDACQSLECELATASIISKERGYMRPKITFLLYLFLLFGAVHIGKKWVELNKIYNADESLKSEYAITNSLEQDWLDIGAVNVVTYEESGMRYIYFDEYTVSYQAFDEKDDILGTIIARRTGNETIKVEVKLMQDLYMVRMSKAGTFRSENEQMNFQNGNSDGFA